MVWKQLSILHDTVMDNIEDRPGAHNLFFPWDKSLHRIKLLSSGEALDWAETWQHRQILNKYLLWSAMLDVKAAVLLGPSNPTQFLPWVSTLNPAGNGFQWHLPGSGKLWGDQTIYQQNLLHDHALSHSTCRLWGTSIHGNNRETVRKIIWGFSMSLDSGERNYPFKWQQRELSLNLYSQKEQPLT